MSQQFWYRPSISFYADTKESFRTAMQRWNAYLPEYRRVCFDSTTHPFANFPFQDGRNLIYKTPSSDPQNLAYNRYYRATYSGITYLIESDININSNKKWINGYAADAFDVRSVFLHETGHTIGLGHTQDTRRSAVMYKNFDKGEIRDWPTTDDINGINACYS
ncbi:matrixin family metalloprotease [Enorma phocaeensis]|uniref:matrixin family metalloprotease n=1 Tax=Enorma phocaeensis TaxID=1871019 RepID=UPI00195E630D|nr:matrixin family metalloprotease [Enorma phocaeensis]